MYFISILVQASTATDLALNIADDNIVYSVLIFCILGLSIAVGILWRQNLQLNKTVLDVTVKLATAMEGTKDKIEGVSSNVALILNELREIRIKQQEK